MLGFEEPRSMDKEQIKNKVREFIAADVLGEPERRIADNEPLFSSDLVDSFSFVQIAVFIEHEFGVFLTDKGLSTQDIDTIEQFADYILNKA